jgi:flagellar basal-body rod protein FlgB
MSMIDTPLIRGLTRALDSGSFRQQLLASNLANVDTPGYHTRDIRTFAGEIQQAMAGETVQMTPVARPLRGLLERPDGNNVSVERESLLMAENQLHFQIAIQLLRSEFRRISEAITSGGTS